MNRDFYVVKFGEKYYKGVTAGAGTTTLTLVDYFTDAQKYRDLDRELIQHLLDLGGSVVEVNIREYDYTYSLEKEWEENDVEEADGTEKDS